MIAVLGSINMDLVATMSRLPGCGETVAGRSFAMAAGGKGANQALAARRAGQDVAMFGAVGDDEFSKKALALLDHSSVDLRGVRKVEGTTGLAFVLVREDGENMIAIVPGANEAITLDDVTRALDRIGSGDILLLQQEIPIGVVEYALEEARRRGIVTCLNIAPFGPESSRLAQLADIVIANQTEFEALIGQHFSDPSELEAALLLKAKDGSSFVVTLGAEGVVATRNGFLHRAASLKIDAVDTVGAGDTFCGYLAAGLDEGLDFATSLQRAVCAAALACTRTGAQPAIPHLAEVEHSFAPVAKFADNGLS